MNAGRFRQRPQPVLRYLTSPDHYYEIAPAKSDFYDRRETEVLRWWQEKP